jgi:hypothetical protein
MPPRKKHIAARIRKMFFFIYIPPPLPPLPLPFLPFFLAIRHRLLLRLPVLRLPPRRARDLRFLPLALSFANRLAPYFLRPIQAASAPGFRTLRDPRLRPNLAFSARNRRPLPSRARLAM